MKTLTKITALLIFTISCSFANINVSNKAKLLVDLVNLSQKQTIECTDMVVLLGMNGKNPCDEYAIAMDNNYEKFVDKIIEKYGMVESLRAKIEVFYKEEGKKYQTLKNVISSLKRIKYSKEDFSEDLQESLKKSLKTKQLCSDEINFKNKDINAFKKSICDKTYKTIVDGFLDRQLSLIETELYNQISKLDEAKLFSDFQCSFDNDFKNIGCSDEYINNLKKRYENTRLIIWFVASKLYPENHEVASCKVSDHWQQFDLIDECLTGIKNKWTELENEQKTKIVNTIVTQIFSESRPPFIYNSIFELVASKYGYCKVQQEKLDCTKAFGWIEEFNEVDFSDFNNIEDTVKNTISNSLKPISLSSCIVAYPDIVKIYRKEAKERVLDKTIISWEAFQTPFSNDKCELLNQNNKRPLGIKLTANAGQLTQPFKSDSTINDGIAVTFNHLQFFSWLKNTKATILPKELINTLDSINSRYKKYITVVDEKLSFQPFESIVVMVMINKSTGKITNNSLTNCSSLSDCPELTNKVNQLIKKNITSLIPPPFCIKDNLELFWCDGINDEILLGRLTKNYSIELNGSKDINVLGIGTAQFTSAHIAIKNDYYSIKAVIKNIKLKELDLDLGDGRLIMKTAQEMKIEFNSNNDTIKTWLEKKLNQPLKETQLEYINDSLLYTFKLNGVLYRLNFSKSIEKQLQSILINISKNYANNWFTEFLQGQSNKETQIADFKLEKICQGNNCTLVISTISTSCQILTATINTNGTLSTQNNSSECFSEWLDNNLDELPTEILENVLSVYENGLNLNVQLQSNIVSQQNVSLGFKIQFQPKYKIIINTESTIESGFDVIKNNLIQRICNEINEHIQIEKQGKIVNCKSLQLNDEIDLSFTQMQSSISVEKVRITKDGLDFSKAYIDSDEINNQIKNLLGRQVIFGKVKFNFEKKGVIATIPIQVELKNILTTSWMLVKIKINKSGIEIDAPSIKSIITLMVGKLNEIMEPSQYIEVNLLGRVIVLTNLSSVDENITLDIIDQALNNTVVGKLKWNLEDGLIIENGLECGAINITIDKAINKVDFSSFDSFISLGAPIIDCENNTAKLPIFFKFTGYPQINIGNMKVEEDEGFDFEWTNDIQIPVGGPYLLGPITLNNNLVKANIKEKKLKLFSDISLLRLDELVKIDGNLTWDFKKNTISSDGPLIIANMFNMQDSKTLIRYKKTGNKRKGVTIAISSSESPLKDVFSFEGCLFTGENDCQDLLPKLNLENCNQKLLDGQGLGGHELLLGCGNVSIFKDLLKAEVNLELTKDKITLNANLKLPVVKSAKIKYVSDLLLLNPQLSGSTSLDLGITNASISFSQSKTSASILARAFGISVGFVTPDLNKFDWDMLEDLLKKMLRLDIKDIKKAVEAIMSGNFEINPASRFGKKSKGGSSGKPGASGESGVSGKGGTGTSGGDFVSGYQQGYTQIKNGTTPNNKPTKNPTAFDQGLREGARQAENKITSDNSNGSSPIVPSGDASYNFQYIENKCKYIVFKEQNNKKTILSDNITLELTNANNECNSNTIKPIGNSLLFRNGFMEYAIFLKNNTDIIIFNEFGRVNSTNLSTLKLNINTNSFFLQNIVTMWGRCKNQSNNCNFDVYTENGGYKTKTIYTNRNNIVYWSFLSSQNNEFKRKSITEYKSSSSSNSNSCFDNPHFASQLQTGSEVITVFDSNNQSSAFVINNVNVTLYKNCSQNITFKSKKPLNNWLSSEMCSGYSRYLDINQIIQPLEYLVKNNIVLTGKQVESIGTDGLLLSSNNYFTPISTKKINCKNKIEYTISEFTTLIKESLIDKSMILNIDDALNVFEQRIFDKNSWEMCKPKKDLLYEMCK